MDKKNTLIKQVKKEIKDLYKTQEEIEIHPETGVVWILSGPGNFFKPLDDEEKYMQWMDRHRILYGILLARAITAKRCKKETKDLLQKDIQDNGPLIIYNGIPDENAALRKALNKSLVSYPLEKVIIIDKVIDGKKKRNIIHTKDQILSFPLELLKKEKTNTIAIISHIQHFPRIMRYLRMYKIFPDTLQVEIYGLKPPKEMNKEFSEEEANKVWDYYKKGDLSWRPIKI